MSLDSVTLSVIHNKFKEIVSEMDATLVNTAFSPIICDAMDMANGLYRADGRTIAQGERGLPIFVGNMEFMVANIADHFSESMTEGDVYLVNDPYHSGTHLNDVCLVKPFFVDDTVLTFLANTAHWVDVGGATPGGFSVTRDLYQEGIRIKPVRISDGGEAVETTRELVLNNVRLPRDSAGDLQAQINALHRGERRLKSILNEYGVETIRAAIDGLESSSKAQMVARIRELPDGHYSYTDFLDNDGVTKERLPISIDLVVDKGTMHLDFSGSARVARGPFNLPPSTTKSACHLTIKHMFPDIPINAGCFDPIDIKLPENSVVNAEAPAPTLGYISTTMRVVDTVMGVLAEAMPDEAPAQPFSTAMPMSISGQDVDDEPFVMVFYVGGGLGAYSDQDGLSFANPPMARSIVPASELYERDYPIMFTRRGARNDSEGPGKYRGGFGLTYEFELLSEEAEVSFLADRSEHMPNGVSGGGKAAGSRVTFTRDGKTYTTEFKSKGTGVGISTGDRVRLDTPGGGGHGNPRDRHPEAVRVDVAKGYVSVARARDEYGVVIVERNGEKVVDWVATEDQRGEQDG